MLETRFPPRHISTLLSLPNTDSPPNIPQMFSFLSLFITIIIIYNVCKIQSTGNPVIISVRLKLRKS